MQGAGKWEMNCPYCGTEIDAKVKYCSVCGSPANKRLPKTASAVEQTAGKKGNSRWVAMIVYIVVIVLILSVPAYITIRAVVNVTTTKVSLSVTDAAEVADPFHSPSDGNRFVALTATIVNNGKSTLNLVPFDFHVKTADGIPYDYTALYDDTLPEALTAGSTAIFSITFEVPADKTPTRLYYQTVFTSDFVETAIGSVSPRVVRMTIAVTGVTDAVALWPVGSKGVLVGFDMTNGYNEPLELTPSMFKLQTSSGTIVNYSAVATIEPLGALAAGATGSASVAFEIPTWVSPEMLIFESGSLHVEATIL